MKNKAMKRVILILFWSLSISHLGIVCTAQDKGDEKAHSMPDLNESAFKMTWPGAGVDELMAPVGLIDRLPPDGTWARFEKDEALITIASVGKMTVAEQPCRWIEVILEKGGRDLIWKLLIQEKYLKRGRNILEQALSVWHCEGWKEPLNITGMSPSVEFGALTFLLIGPDDDIRLLASQVVETKLGHFECAGWTGRQLTKLDQGEVDATYRQWVHERAPFGVLRSEIEYTANFDGRVRQAKTSITLVEVGTGARSQISTANRSVEELTARPFAPVAGWQWAVLPCSLGWRSMATRGLAMAIDRNGQEFQFMLAYPWSPGGAKYRPVAFDAHQLRYEFDSRTGGASRTVGLGVFALAQGVLASDQVKYVGIEKLSQEMPKEPPSLMGKSLPNFWNIGFNFVPERVDEKPILICFFDMNQRPSRHLVSELAKTADELRDKGVTVVAVQASEIDENKLNEWVKENNIPFSVGIIQGDVEKTRLTWGVRSLPWLILTDRKHIVRAEGFDFEELGEKIKESNDVEE